MTNKTPELLTMNQAASRLKTTRTTLYRWLREGRLPATKAGRQWRFKEEDLTRFLDGKRPKIDLPANIEPFLLALRERLKEPSPQTDNLVNDAAKLMIEIGLEMGASSLHLSSAFVPESGETETWFRVRIDGTLQLIAQLDSRLLKALVAEWKRMAACYPDETKHPQDGRIIISSQKEPGSQLVDLRVSFLPTAFGEVLTVKIADKSGSRLHLDNLPLNAEAKSRLRKSLKKRGLIVAVCGAPGSARDKVLSACLGEVAAPNVKLFTVEHPSWEFLPWATQVSTRHMPKGRKVAVTVGSILRSEPDVLGVPLVEDEETFQQVQRSALEGALALIGIRAEDSRQGLGVLRDLSPSRGSWYQTIDLVISQRFVRELCPSCSEPAALEKEQERTLRQRALAEGLDLADWGQSFRVPCGCESCGGSGYKGRAMIMEVLPLSYPLKRLLQEGDTGPTFLEAAVGEGLISLDAQTLALVSQGRTSLEEAERFLAI